MPSEAELQLLFANLNSRFFNGALRGHAIAYNSRLTTVSGRITYRPPLIELSTSLLAAHPDALEETLLHEMVHAWLRQQGQPAGHGSEFKRKMREVGLRSIYHYLPVARRRRSRRRYVLSCPRCQAQFMRRRRPGYRVSCARCSPKRFSSSVELTVRRIS